MAHHLFVRTTMLVAVLIAAAVSAVALAGCAGPQPTSTQAATASPTGPTPTIEPTPTDGQPPPTDGQPTPSPTARPTLGTIELQPFASGLGQLTLVTHAGDGSGLLYALDQSGAIRIVEADGTVRPGAFLDIRDRVRSGGEQGLLGLAFHPDYESNGRFFVNYTDRSGHTVVAQFTRTGDSTTADGASERRILSFEQPFSNHNGGMVAFGPDGYLYISTGDGGGGGDPLGAGQDLAMLLGKILRIDVDSGEPYAVPPDNPFADGAGGVRPEIWSYGLRNPWRFSFDRQSGDMFIGDVGQGTWEEINAEPAGEGGRNYGWNVMEGPDCFRGANCDTSGLTLPAAWFPTRGEGHCAVTGGFVYRGQAVAGLAGIYVFGDYCSGVIWGLEASGAVAGEPVNSFELARSGLNISAFGEDEQGELYVVGQDGRVVRLTGR